jgi:pimeloyl-ACP methyl ester carboxylesterase
MKIRGFRRAILSTLRSGMLYNQKEVYQRLGKQKRHILILWGKEDSTIPLLTCDKFKEHLSQAEFRVIENAGHVPHYELPDVVNPLLINFLLNE